jgi:PTH1 family peptidyl-tRNA hydrolase
MRIELQLGTFLSKWCLCSGGAVESDTVSAESSTRFSLPECPILRARNMSVKDNPVPSHQHDSATTDEVAGLRLVVGLGNPGSEYANNRHNLGFRVVDALADKHGFSFKRHKGKVRVAEGEISGHDLLLAKPQTFMNLSGGAVSRVSRSFEVSPEDILVVYDDLDLPLGRLRLRPEGGSGGHRGMRSIIDQLGTRSFARLRVGIDRPPGQVNPADYVLEAFTGDEEAIVAEAIRQAVAAIECCLEEGLVVAMDRFNRLTPDAREQGQGVQS